MALTEAERDQLAERLASLKYRRARREIRRLDREANLKIWRNYVSKDELHTTYDLPNLGVRIILVEKDEEKPIKDGQKLKKDYYYAEARVEPLENKPAGSA